MRPFVRSLEPCRIATGDIAQTDIPRHSDCHRLHMTLRDADTTHIQPTLPGTDTHDTGKDAIKGVLTITYRPSPP